MSGLRAVIFDLDGVLVDTARYHYLGWKRLADELDVPFDEEKNEQLKGVDRLNSLKRLLGKGYVYSEQELRRLADRKNSFYVDMIREITPTDLFPGAKDLITGLRGAGVLVSVASASKNARTVLRNLEIEDLLDDIVDGHDFKRGKPDPEIFLAAARRLKTAPAECVVVEDAEAGVRAGKAAGMATVGFGSPEVLRDADLVVQELSELSLGRLRELVCAP